MIINLALKGFLIGISYINVSGLNYLCKITDMSFVYLYIGMLGEIC